ncbi:FAD-dependent oxidoreductase [bacterium]
MQKVDILVIGGGPAGIISAVSARRYYKDKNIFMIKNVEKAVIPCGIPYMFKSLNDPEDNKLGNLVLEKNNIGFVVDEVTSIDKENKIVETKSGEKYSYEKLILAVGSKPIIPSIPGIEKEGVYPINKEMKYLKEVVEKIKKSKNVLIVGGGFIGIELADELSKIEGLKVYLVELLPSLLANSFDIEFSKEVQDKLISNGVNILIDTKVAKFEGDGHVEKVIFSNGGEILTDAVILGMGAIPNTDLAVKCGLEINHNKTISVDEYMRTSNPDIFAVGDCALKKDFYTRKAVSVMLASTATSEARIAGANLYNIKLIRENKGTIAAYSTYVDGLVLGSAGLTEASAIKEGFEIVTGFFEGVDKHPNSMPGVNKIKVKLVFAKRSGIILGGQVLGGMSCGEMINIISVAVQQRMLASEFETLQMATHPYLTTAPTMYPLVVAAQDAVNKLCK